MNRKLLLGSLTLWLCLAAIWFLATPANAQPQAILAIPTGLAGFPGDTLVVPVFVSTDLAISQAQVVVEFDAKDFTFINATIGPDAPGFFVLQTLVHPSIPITTPGATENVLVQLAGNNGKRSAATTAT
jgi:hypothetical protein